MSSKNYRLLKGSTATFFLNANSFRFDVDLLETMFDVQNMGDLLDSAQTRDYLETIKPHKKEKPAVKEPNKIIPNEVKWAVKEQVEKKKSATKILANDVMKVSTIKKDVPIFEVEDEHMYAAKDLSPPAMQFMYFNNELTEVYKEAEPRLKQISDAAGKKMLVKIRKQKQKEGLATEITHKKRNWRKQPLETIDPHLGEMFFII